MQIKVCGLRDNIEAVVRLKPDMIGLIFYKHSKRYLGEDRVVQDYIKSITGVYKAGVFVDAAYDGVMATVAAYGLDIVQLHGNESVALCCEVQKEIPVIKAFSMQASFDFNSLEDYMDVCTYFLFDTHTKGHGGSGEKFEWDILKNYRGDKKFFLSGGLGLEDVDAIKQLAHPALIGIDINSRLEDAPGFKNIEKLKKMIHEIRN